MRLWTLHPCYLDTKGLLALWREGLLARHVLSGKTKGYRHHPQLIRFRNTDDPLNAIDAYLSVVLNEARKRQYAFDENKINPHGKSPKITATSGQLQFEFAHLRKKLLARNHEKAQFLDSCTGNILHNPVFIMVPGNIESWEKS